jgi:uncharacterized protein
MDVSSSSRQPVTSSGSLLRFMRHHPLVCYFLMAYGLSWLGWLPYMLSQSGLGLLPFHLSQLVGLPGAFLGPCLSGFLMTAVTEGKTGVRHLLRRFVLWRVGWQWYLFALIGGPAIMVLGTLTLPGAVGALHLPSLQLVLVFLPVLVLEIFTSGLSEEPGWRGFALPRLQQRHGPLLGTLVLGLLWGCWHLPLFLTAWEVVGTSGLPICEFILGTMSLAIVITWVFNHTQGSLLVAILLHATIDAFGSVAWTSLFPTHILLTNAYLATLIGFGVVALLLIVVTRGRLGYPRALPPPDPVPTLDGGKP